MSKIKLEDKMWTTMISVIFVFLSHSKQHVNLSPLYLGEKNEKMYGQNFLELVIHEIDFLRTS